MLGSFFDMLLHDSVAKHRDMRHCFFGLSINELMFVFSDQAGVDLMGWLFLVFELG